MISVDEKINRIALNKQLLFLSRGQNRNVYYGDCLWMKFHDNMNMIEVTSFELSGRMVTSFHKMPTTIGELIRLIKPDAGLIIDADTI